MSPNRSSGTKKGWGTMPRRTFLKGAATVAVAASAGGLPGLLTAGQAPAYAKGTKLHMLQWLNFVPAGDKVFLAQAEEFGKQMGVEVQIERIAQNDVRTRAAAAIEAKSGPDIILIMHNQPLLFSEGLADVSDVAEAIGKE
jgi:multiple sugar transport system substrate-binding protein